MNQQQRIMVTIGGIFVAVLIILLAVFGSFWGWQGDGFGMMGRGMMGGWGTMLFMPILWIVVLGLIIWVIMAALQRSEESSSTSIDHKTESPMNILKRRYAQGEIDKEEYEAKKKDLT